MFHARQNMIGRANVGRPGIRELAQRRWLIQIRSSPAPSQCAPSAGRDNVQHRRKCPPMPDRARASFAAMLLRRGLPGGSRTPPWQFGTGKMVRKPWITGLPKMRGIGHGFCRPPGAESGISAGRDERATIPHAHRYASSGFSSPRQNRRKLAELPDLFFQRHLFEQRINRGSRTTRSWPAVLSLDRALAIASGKVETTRCADENP